MKKILNKISFKELTNKYLGLVIYLIIASILGFVGYFTYQNVYITSISPKPLDSNDIIAKKQKVNLFLFDKITNNIEGKKSPNEILNISNPFE